MIKTINIIYFACSSGTARDQYYNVDGNGAYNYYPSQGPATHYINGSDYDFTSRITKIQNLLSELKGSSPDPYYPEIYSGNNNDVIDDNPYGLNNRFASADVTEKQSGVSSNIPVRNN